MLSLVWLADLILSNPHHRSKTHHPKQLIPHPPNQEYLLENLPKNTLRALECMNEDREAALVNIALPQRISQGQEGSTYSSREKAASEPEHKTEDLISRSGVASKVMVRSVNPISAPKVGGGPGVEGHKRLIIARNMGS